LITVAFISWSYLAHRAIDGANYAQEQSLNVCCATNKRLEMARLKLMPNLTQGYSSVLDHQIRTTHKGQAYWANTGPFGTTCGECVFWGYFRTRRTTAGEAVKARHVQACAKFHELTGKHGAVVPANAPSCRYFERKAKEEKEK
jgi:hypothetical protein